MTMSDARSAIEMMASHRPPYLMTSDPGSFARQTIVERKPQIIRSVLAEHAYPADIVVALRAFRVEIASGSVQPLHEHAPDVAFWHAQWRPHEGRSWLELPWYFAETYFYRRLLEAVRYVQPGPWQGVDPFAPQKRAQEVAAITQIRDVWPSLATISPQDRFSSLFHACLWGNRADLSNLTVKEQAVGDTTTERHHIIIDHTERVEELLSCGLHEVAFINDNVGADSLFDLVLSDHLLTEGLAKRVTFHLKPQPFFVSDAMPADIRHIIDHLNGGPDDDLTRLATRLKDALTTGSLRLESDPFWATSLFFSELPTALSEQLQRADLIILKGDVNYRRLLEDRHWPPTIDLGEVAAGFPRPFVALRTLKGELIAGLQPGEAEALAAADPAWLINGKRGLIHLITDEAESRQPASSTTP